MSREEDISDHSVIIANLDKQVQFILDHWNYLNSVQQSEILSQMIDEENAHLTALQLYTYDRDIADKLHEELGGILWNGNTPMTKE